jgi:A/G-specific adenine glycosylase
MKDPQSDLGLMEATCQAFVQAVWERYRVDGRDLPWRRTRDPYEILVSEVMLQQTQVARVLGKYSEFLASFPTVDSLAAAPIADILAVWSGLGYNRRALSLQRAAALVVAEYGGAFPESLEDLRRLPGVGASTAAALSAFAFGRPHPFIETNIRSAFIHFFFPGSTAVHDGDILPLVDRTLDRANPREWFYALMDYGVWVKKTFGNPNRRSRHYTAQPPLAGSRRELRAQIVRALLAAGPQGTDLAAVRQMLPAPGRDDGEVASVLADLEKEGFLAIEQGVYRLA